MIRVIKGDTGSFDYGSREQLKLILLGVGFRVQGLVLRQRECRSTGLRNEQICYELICGL